MRDLFILRVFVLFFQIFLQMSKVNASLLKIKFLVPLTNRPQHTTWISHSNNIGRNILCYNTASADDYIVSNCTPGRMIAPAPIQQFLPMETGMLY